MIETRKLSIFLDRMIPPYVRDTYPQFYQFFRSYLQFIESEDVTQDGEKIKFPYRMISDLRRNFDVDSMEQEFLALTRRNYSANFPPATSIAGGYDERQALKSLTKFFKSKGTEDSIKYLFKLFFDEVVQIRYPNDNVLKLSSARFRDVHSLNINIGQDDYIDQFYQRFIISENGATAFVTNQVGNYDQFTGTDSSGDFIYALRLSEVNGRFLEGERVFILNTETELPYDGIVTGFNDAPLRITEGDSGLLSSSRVIGDRRTHSEFSYIISSSMPSNLWLDLVTDLAHPAGFIIFAELFLLTVVDIAEVTGENSIISFVDENGVSFAIFNFVRIEEFFTFEYFDMNKLSNLESAAFTISDFFRFRITDFQFRRQVHLPDSLTPHSIISIAPESDPENYSQVIR